MRGEDHEITQPLREVPEIGMSDEEQRIAIEVAIERLKAQKAAA